MGFFSLKPSKPKKEGYEKLYRVKVEPVENKDMEQTNTGEVIIKKKEEGTA